MFKIKEYIVKPLSSKKENFFLILAFILLLIIAGTILKIRYKPHYKQQIANNEISSFNDLNSIELGVYSSIRNSLTDIMLISEENGNKLPDIIDLEEEKIPPFFKDSTWKNKGSIEWKLLSHEGEKFYLGLSGDITKVGNFLILVDNKDIQSSSIYYLKDAIPNDIFQDFDKYEHLFKKIIPYTGKDERKKFKGE